MEPELPGRVRPVIATTLRFLTKTFPTPMNLQYITKADDKGMLVFSDGVHTMKCTVGDSYKKLFQNNRFENNKIFTVFQATRERKPPHMVTLTNMMVAPKHSQVEGQIGQPIPF